jgi:hypothetical protein
MPWLANLLWSVAAAGAAACGRLGFEARTAGVDADASALTIASSLALESACGQPIPAAAALHVTNTGTDDVTLTDIQTTGGFALSTALPLTISAGATTALSIRPPAAIIGTDVPGAQKSGTLTITVGADVHEVALTATVVGAALSVFNGTGGALSLDLVGSSGACPTPAAGQIVNAGNRSVTLTFGGSPAFAIAGFSGGVIDAGSSAAFSVRAITASGCTGAGVIMYTVTGDTCDATPGVLQASFTITGASSCACS